MLTFESEKNDDRLEIHGDSEGLLYLSKILSDMANQQGSVHQHMMTKDWGGNDLTNDKQGLENHLFHHVKIFFWR